MKLLEIGVTDTTPLDSKKRIITINGITFFFLSIGIPLTAFLFMLDDMPTVIPYYILFLVILYFTPLILNYKGKHIGAGLFIVVAGDLATASAPILVGLESNAQYLLALISGLPFIMFGQSMGRWRLLLAFLVFPIWIAVEFYCSYHPPIIELNPELLKGIGYFYGAAITLWGIYIFYYFNGVTERQVETIEKQNAILKQKNNQLEQFNYVATHNLKAPINNIDGLSSLLKLESADKLNKSELDSLDQIKRSTAIARETIENITEALRGISLAEPKKHILLENVLTDVKSNLSLSISEFDVKLNVDFSNCPKVYFGAVGLHSIFQNLMSNAVKYHSPERKPEITITSEIKGQYALLTFTDNGKGMNMEREGKQLFNLFHRVHTDAEGSGIGLYMVRHSLDNNGGRIEASSELNVGSTFKVYIPLSA